MTEKELTAKLGPRFTVEKMARDGRWKRVHCGRRATYMLGFLDGLVSAGALRVHLRLRIDAHGDTPACVIDFTPTMKQSRKAREYCEF